MLCMLLGKSSTCSVNAGPCKVVSAGCTVHVEVFRQNKVEWKGYTEGGLNPFVWLTSCRCKWILIAC